MIDEIKRNILEVISDGSVQWNWYKLDRSLASRGMVDHGNLAALASEMAAEGFVNEASAENSPLSVYTITEKGRQALRQSGS